MMRIYNTCNWQVQVHRLQNSLGLTQHRMDFLASLDCCSLSMWYHSIQLRLLLQIGVPQCLYYFPASGLSLDGPFKCFCVIQFLESFLDLYLPRCSFPETHMPSPTPDSTKSLLHSQLLLDDMFPLSLVEFAKVVFFFLTISLWAFFLPVR